MSRGLNIFVNIGAKLLPSINSAAGAVERRFGVMNRRLKVQAAEAKAAWKSMGNAAGPLLGLAAAGGLMVTAKAAIGDSAELAHQMQNLRNAGLSANETARAFAAANRTIGQVPTSGLTDNLKLIGETRMAYGDLGHAIENLSFNTKVGGLLDNLLGEGDSGDRFNSIVRALEMRGAAMDPKRYQRETNMLYQAMVATHGKVNPEEFLAFSQTANPYTKGLSTGYLYRTQAALVQEFGGDRSGTMLNTFMGTILGKAKNKISTEAWMKLGLLDPKQVVYNKVGPVGWRPGAIKGTDLAMQDPLKWAETVLIPAMRAHGVNTADQLSLQKMLMPLFRDRNSNRLANVLTYDNDRNRLHKDAGIIEKVPGADAAFNQSLRQDPKLAWSAVTKSMNNVLSVLFGTGQGESPVAVAMLHVANGLNMIAQTFIAHPWLAKGVGALLLGTTGIAGLKVLGIGLRFALSPLKGLFALLFKVGPRQIGLVGWLLRGISRAGPLLLRGLVTLGPLLLRGLAMAFGLLSNPVGWAILAVAVIAIAWRFRHEIAGAWNKYVVPWFKGAWVAIKNYAMSIDWKGIGWKIADALTFGLATKFRDAMKGMPSAAAIAGNVGMNSKAGGLAGMRASGGGAQRRRTYLVGERGPELFTPNSSGSITPNHRLRGGGGAPLVGEINIYGATDPQAVALQVRHELTRLANGAGDYLSD